MTIEEWLNKRIEDTEKNCREKHLDSYDNGYWDGYYDALDDLLRELPLFEHEVTVRGLLDFCNTRKCLECPFNRESDWEDCRFRHEILYSWDIDDIERRMKEARK